MKRRPAGRFFCLIYRLASLASDQRPNWIKKSAIKFTRPVLGLSDAVLMVYVAGSGCETVKDPIPHMAKSMLNTSLLTAALMLASISPSQAAEVNSACERCAAILQEIHQTLTSRCDQVPSQEALRQQPIYLFLSIFDEVSQGVDRQMRDRIYRAALDGMQCEDPNAGVKAAQSTANKLLKDAQS